MEESGYLDELVARERSAVETADGSAMREVYEAEGEILRQSPALPERFVYP